MPATVKQEQKRNCHGKDGRDIVIPVPAGTIIFTAETGEVIADLTQPGSLSL